MFVGSGAVKDDLLVFGKARESGLKFLEGERALKMQAAASGLIGISAHQKRLAGCDPGIGFLRGDAYRGGHVDPPLFLLVFKVLGQCPHYSKNA